MDPKLSVLFIVSQPDLTPTLSVHADLMRHLPRERVEVHVLYPRSVDREPWASAPDSVRRVLPEPQPGVRLRPFEFGPARSGDRRALASGAARAAGPALRDALTLPAYVRRHRIDVIHCEYNVLNGGLGYVLARVSPARYLVHMHSNYGTWLKGPSVRAIANADGVVGVSDWIGRTVHERGGIARERIHTVHNGIDVSRWDPMADGGAVRGELGLAPGDPMLVQVAQLVAWKRQHLVIEAFGALLEDHPGAKLMLLGRELDPSLRYEQQLRRQVAEAGLGNRVVFAGHRRDVAAVLAAADVFVLPSQNEPFGLAFAEAMAMCKPVVGVRSGAAPEVVLDGSTGLLGPLDDVAELTRNLERLVADPELRQQLGAAGRRRVLERFTAQRMAEAMDAVYREIIAG